MHLVIKDIFDTSCKEQLLYQHNIFHTGRPKEAIISSGSQHHHMAWVLSRPAKIQAHQTQGDWKGARIIIFLKFLLLHLFLLLLLLLLLPLLLLFLFITAMME